jgi:ribonuclease P protein component
MNFRPEERLRRRSEFLALYARGTRVRGRYGTLFTLPNALPIGRLGIAATRKFGGSVERNRAKRLIREIFRRNKIAAGYDIVIVPKRELLKASLNALEEDYRHNLQRSLRLGQPHG